MAQVESFTASVLAIEADPTTKNHVDILTGEVVSCSKVDALAYAQCVTDTMTSSFFDAFATSPEVAYAELMSSNYFTMEGITAIWLGMAENAASDMAEMVAFLNDSEAMGQMEAHMALMAATEAGSAGSFEEILAASDAGSEMTVSAGLIVDNEEMEAQVANFMAGEFEEPEINDGFACGDMEAGDFASYNTDMFAEAGATCDAGILLLGGYFFSSFLGSFEAFLTLVPSIYCTPNNLAKIGSGASFYGFFLYYLHGWGESAGLLAEIYDFLESIISDANMVYKEGLTIIAPDDNATPFGGRTWYQNSDFTGYHTDMIVFELPAFAEQSLGLATTGSALFGCSMGGAGSYTLFMSYPMLYNGLVAFNGPTESNPCVIYSSCHLECLVDAFMCELVWTSVGVAYNAYVLMVPGASLVTTGYYSPTAYGIADVTSASVAECTAFGPVVLSAGKFSNLGMTLEPKSTPVMWGADFGISPVPEMSDPYFWLDPYWFVIATQGFEPTHNIHTDAEDCDIITSLLLSMPLFRLDLYPTALSSTSIGTYPMFIMASTDANDQFGIAEMASTFIGSAIFRSGSTESFYEDTYGDLGHSMSLRDFKTALQFFSDVFKSALVADFAGGSLTVTSSPVCSWYLRPDEVIIAQQSPGALILLEQSGDFQALSCGAGGSHESGALRPAFDWGDIDCGDADCLPSNGRKLLVPGTTPGTFTMTPGQSDKFNSFTSGARSQCYDQLVSGALPY
jgi:hypothetical protein